MRETLARFWDDFKQIALFALGQNVGPLTPTLEQLLRIWEVLRIEEHVRYARSLEGRPPKDRLAIARAFVAKSFLNLPTTTALLDRLQVDHALRRLCGFERPKDVPSESTFSRAFAEFATTDLGQRTHESLVKQLYGEGIVGHVSRDATAIEARERRRKARARARRPTRDTSETRASQEGRGKARAQDDAS